MDTPGPIVLSLSRGEILHIITLLVREGTDRADKLQEKVIAQLARWTEEHDPG